MPCGVETLQYCRTVLVDIVFQCHMEVWDCTCGLTNVSGVPELKRGTTECTLVLRVSHYPASLGKPLPGGYKGDSDQLLNLRPRRSNADLRMGQLFTSAKLLEGCVNLVIRSTCVLWTWRRFTTMSLMESCGGQGSRMGHQGCYYKPSGL